MRHAGFSVRALLGSLFILLSIGAVAPSYGADLKRPIERLKHEDRQVRSEAAEVLGNSGDKGAIEPLVSALKDTSSRVRKTAAEALDKLGWKPADRLEKAYYLVASGKWSDAAMLGVVAVEPIVAAARDEDFDLRRTASRTLIQIGAEAFDASVAILKHKDPAYRASAANVLAMMGDRRAAKSLVGVLKDPVGQVRSAAAAALNRLKWRPNTTAQKAWFLAASGKWEKLTAMGKSAVEPLLLAVKDKSISYQRVRAATILGSLGDKRAVGALIATLKDKESDLRKASAEALGKLRDTRAVGPLIAALKDKSLEVRYTSVQALGELGDKRAVEPLIAVAKGKEYGLRFLAAEALGKLGDKRAAAAIAEVTSEETGSEYTPATDALIKLGSAGVKPLLAMLTGQDSRKRRGAALALGRLGDKRAVEPLINALLTDKESWVRQAAARALGLLRDKRAVKPLFKTMTDTRSNSAQREAAEALAKIGQPAVKPLTEALKHKSADVRELAARSLDEVNWKPKTRKEKARRLVGLKQWKPLADMGADAVEPLITAVVDGWTQPKAMAVLKKIGARAVTPMIRAMKDEDPEIRAAAAWALGQMKDKRAVGPLMTALKDENKKVRKAATEALAGLGGNSFEALAASLKSKDPVVRRRAVEVLGKMRDPRVVVPLLEALKDKNVHVRFEAACSLDKHPDKRAVEPLIKMMTEKDSYTGHVARDALARIPAAFDRLVEVLKSGTYKTRLRAVCALGEMRDKRAVPHLVKALRDPRTNVSSGAAGYLRMIFQWKPKNDVERASACIAVSCWEDAAKFGKAAIEPAIAALKSYDAYRRMQAASLLARIGDKRIIVPMIAALKDGSSKVRGSAVKALARFGDKRAAVPMVPLLDDDSLAVAAAAAEALAGFKDTRTVEPLIKELKYGSFQKRVFAAKTLGRIGDTRAVKPLIAILRDADSSVRFEAAESLGMLGDARAVEPLKKRLKDPNEAVRQAAAAALTRLAAVKKSDNADDKKK